MLSFGGLMKNILGALTAVQFVGMASKTNTVSNIIDHAADNAERVADLLEKVVEGLEEDQDDLPMQ